MGNAKMLEMVEIIKKVGAIEFLEEEMIGAELDLKIAIDEKSKISIQNKIKNLEGKIETQKEILQGFYNFEYGKEII